jgi:uncharacterized protein (DUF2141 family)
MTIFLITNIIMLQSQITTGNTLKLNFELTEQNNSQILVALYNSEENHMSNNPFKSAQVEVKNGKAEVVLDVLESGYYSFSYYHDINSNEKLDKNFVGVPTEPYGFSNGEKGRLGPPDFKDCKIYIEKDTTIKINIK